MSPELSKCYKLLSILLQYPRDVSEVRQVAKELYGLVEDIKDHRLDRVREELDGFIRFLEASDLRKVQEEYVATFDLFPLCPPYISHHIYGESYRKGEYMVRLIKIYRKHGFEVPETLKGELPDHISVVTGFLGFLEQSDRQKFMELIMKGLKKMADSVGDKGTPYRALILLTHALCLLDYRNYDKGAEKRSEVEDVGDSGNIDGNIDEGGVIKCWIR